MIAHHRRGWKDYCMYIFIVYVGFEIGLFWFDKGEIAVPRVTDKLKLNNKYILEARICVYVSIYGFP